MTGGRGETKNEKNPKKTSPCEQYVTSSQYVGGPSGRHAMFYVPVVRCSRGHGPFPALSHWFEFACPFSSFEPAPDTPLFFVWWSQARKLDTAAKKDEKRAKDR